MVRHGFKCILFSAGGYPIFNSMVFASQRNKLLLPRVSQFLVPFSSSLACAMRAESLSVCTNHIASDMRPAQHVMSIQYPSGLGEVLLISK